MIKYSIIVPTFKHFEDCLKPCIESIINHTNLRETEVIVVANGCGDDGTTEYIKSLGAPFKLIELGEPSGFTFSTNRGIEAASGEYVVLLNNDNVIQGSDWLSILVSPFENDPSVGITGAAKAYHLPTSSEFILFFCAMIRKSIFKHLGLPDEIFNPGYGEDIDFCIKVKKAGFKVVQVPDDLTLDSVREDHVIRFPIWHRGSVTVHEVPTWGEVVPRNEAILLERYGKPLKDTYIGCMLDEANNDQLYGIIGVISNQMPEDGLLHIVIDERTSVTFSKTGFFHQVFVGKDGLPYLSKTSNLVDISSVETIKKYVLECGNKTMWQFGGNKEGGYNLQQDSDEISAFLYDFRNTKVDGYLEIGVAEGGLTRLFCDVVAVNNVTTLDIGWADANYKYTYRNNLLNLKNNGKIDIFRGDSHSNHANEFLQDKKFDFIFIDADHTYDSVVKDTMLAVKSAREGCIFAYHDHIAVPEIGRFYEDMCSGVFPGFTPLKAYGNKFGISTFRWNNPEKITKISIIIPTYNHLEDCLKPCIESLKNTTDLANVEVVVVANGCQDDTRAYLEAQGGLLKFIWIDEPVGFIRAINAGVEACSGEMIVLLNNDVVVTANTWLDLLIAPFTNPKVGITGPYKDWRFFWEKDKLVFRTEYMVFFCAMIRKELFDDIGLLDTDFGIGYEEDIDFAIRAKKAGWEIVQVPHDLDDHLGITKEFIQRVGNNNPGLFPLIHKDKMTFKDVDFDNTRKTTLTQKHPNRVKTSIIIPTYNHLDYLKDCVESIVKYTDLSDVEVIVVVNGCTDETREWVKRLGEPFKVYWIKEPVGYIKAVNVGIKQSMGEYIVLLNNDTKILGNNWLSMLEKPFSNPSVGLTGPVKANRDDLGRDYLLFWCVMIKQEVFNKIGQLDEAFGIGYHEDVDFCIRAENAGYQLVEVSSFPIFHVGGGTFASIFGDSAKRLEEHLPYLYSKHPRAEPTLPPGWFGYGDQDFYKELIKQVPDRGTMVEIGVWQGLSLCSAAKLIREKTINVIAVDTFKGSPWEEEAEGAFVRPGLDLQDCFENNLKLFKIHFNTCVLAMPSLRAAQTVEDGTVDLVFIDGDHRSKSVIADIKAWLPKLKKTGWISGHDYKWSDSVGPAVDSVFGREKVYSQENIWYIIPENKNTRKVFDCFIFFNELDVLEIRLNELDSVVDKFVLCEARYTHQGHPKPLYFNENKERFAKFKHKIDHIIVDEFPSTCVTSWDREHHQRNMMASALKEANSSDVIILSDVDEIISADTVRNYNVSLGICSVKMPLFYYKLDWKLGEPWFKARIFPFSAIGQPTQEGFSQRGTLQWFRGEGDYQVQNQLEGGWHFSFIGDKDSIKAKIQSYAHEEFNNDSFTNDKNIEKAIEQGVDVFKRGLHFQKVVRFNDHPKFVQENLTYYENKNLISSQISPKNRMKVYDCFSFYNELDVLEIRLNELDPFVDYFVLSEMGQTHAGAQKPLYFQLNKPRFMKFLHKIRHIIPPDIETDDPWKREHYQRDYMINLLKENCKDEDIIMISDLDEIPRGGAIAPVITPKYFEQNQYSYYLNYNVGISPITPGTFSRITSYKWLRENNLSLTGLRYHPLSEDDKIADGGWHFSWMGGNTAIVDKLESWAHQEFNKPEFKDLTRISVNINNNKEHFGRDGVGATTVVAIDETFPRFIQDNIDRLKKSGLINTVIVPDKVAIIMPYYNDKEFLTKSVSAIMAQDFNDWELFIADDGSDEDKKAVNILASHPKIHITETTNQGPAAARNIIMDLFPIKEFTHIAFCDSDDMWEPNYLATQLATIRDNDMVYCSVNHKFKDGTAAYPLGIPDPDVYPGNKVMVNTPFIFISSVVCKQEAIGWNRFDSQLDSIEDWEMWLRLDKQGKRIFHNPEKLVTYTVKSGMAGKRTEEQVNIIKKKYA